MSKCIPIQVKDGYGFLCLSKTDFNCPVCDHLHTEADYMKRLKKSKDGVMSMHCKGCKTYLVITNGYNGDTEVWVKNKKVCSRH